MWTSATLGRTLSARTSCSVPEATRSELDEASGGREAHLPRGLAEHERARQEWWQFSRRAGGLESRCLVLHDGTMQYGWGLVVAMSLVAAGCSPSGWVRGTAADDLHCPEKDIVVTGGPVHLRAEGCGQYAEYTCGNTGPHNSGCWQTRAPERLAQTPSG